MSHVEIWMTGADLCSYPIGQGWVRRGVIDWGHRSPTTTYFESRRGWRSRRWGSLGLSRRETGWFAATRCQRSYPSSSQACCPPCPCRECVRAVLAVRETHQHRHTPNPLAWGVRAGDGSFTTYHALPEALHHESKAVALERQAANAALRGEGPALRYASLLLPIVCLRATVKVGAALGVLEEDVVR